MGVLLGLLFLAAIGAFPFFRLVGRSAFIALSLIPFAGLVWSLTLIPEVFSDSSPRVEELHWMPQLALSIVLRLDVLSWIMSLLVTGVGGLVFLYCARYFDEDEVRLARFAAVLMAFVAMMYGLVVADELLTLFLFWEGTTVFSYFLIGQYAGRQQARRAALQALIVTTFGGLAMFVGMILLGVHYGTGLLSEIVAQGYDGQAVTIAAVGLILIGAVSKSALLPFHFWLPGAMAAPTPVSAYLHAAAMVKAGIYLILRMAPGFADMPYWREGLVAVGLLTMLLGGWQALKETDLKLILAYGTVSQLGFMTTMASFGHRDTTTAALALLLGHSTFKATLFLTVGIIDHRVGTRDLRKLSGYGRAYPLIAVLGTAAAASMAGLPPTLGFLAKEAVYGTLLDHGSKLAIIALIGVVLGSVLTVAYSARFVWGAFTSKPGVEQCARTAPDGPLFTVAPILLAALTVGGAFAAAPIDRMISAWTGGLPVDPAAVPQQAYHVALWHGFEPALLLTVLTLAAGAVLFVLRRQVRQFQRAMPTGIDFRGVYRDLIAGLERLAAVVTARTQRGSMPFYQGVIYLFAIGALGVALLLNDVWPDEFVWLDSFAQVFPAVMMVIAAVMVTRMTKRFAAVVVSGLTGYGMVVLFAIQGAPDLALTQILVETVTIVVFVFVLRRLPARIGRSGSRVNPSLRAVIAISFAIIMMVLTVVVMGARQHTPVSVGFPRLAHEGGHGENIVNVTLVDIRAWDTMGELAVVIACAIGVASLVFITGQGERFTPLVALRQGRPRILPVTETVLPRRMVAAETRELAQIAIARGDTDTYAPDDERPEDKRAAWLLAGRTLAPHNRSIVLEVAVRLLFHAFIVYSIYLLFAGHNSPGGGFAAGLVAGIAFVARYLAGGRYEFAEAARMPSGLLMGIGMLLAAGTGAAGFLWGEAALQSFYVSTELPVLGSVSFGSSTIFDVGVYLIVVGLIIGVIRSLAVEVDLQLVEDEDRIVNELPDDVDRAEYDRIRELLGRTDRMGVDGSSAGGRL